MKFTILSHAGICIEHAGVRLVCDPWLIGSCYWRSWWNFPEPDPALLDNLAPQFIYLTHLHWDHFHGPSLKKLFDRKTTVLVPKVPTRRMLDDLRWLGFHDIVEVPHGGAFKMAPDFELRSFQFGIGVDSGAVVSGGGYTLFNCNDCKFFGLPLRQIKARFPRIDFILRSHSSASPVPYCVEGHETLLPQTDAGYDSAEQFARCALYSGARYAIPFASNHCFLHPETRHFNSTATTPDLAEKRYTALAAQSGVSTECVVMPPGSAWSEEDGFKIVPFDFSTRETYVRQMLERNSASLSAEAEREAASVADYAQFDAYFTHFFRSVPWLVRRSKLRPLLFRVRDSRSTHLWLADPARAATVRLDSVPPDTLAIDVHATVLNDCAALRMFSVWTASKRLKIHIASAERLADVNLWFTLLDLYETDVLPLYKNFSLRSIGIRLRRWREPVEAGNILLRRLFLRERFSPGRIYPVPSAGT